jgi:hypothetical protein
MHKKVGSAALMLGLALALASPASAGGGWVDRITDVDTVVAVRMDDDFPLASLMRARCEFAQFVQRPGGSGVENLHCELSDEPVMIPAFQGAPPSSAFTLAGGACVWTSDYWFARDGSLVMASSFHLVVTPSGRVNVTAFYPSAPLDCQ